MKNLSWILVLLLAVACQPASNGGSSNGPTERAEEMQGKKLVGVGEKNGDLKEGAWMTFHSKNGLVESVINYKNGKKHGPYMKADDKGSVKERGYYVNDKLEGDRIKFNRTRTVEEGFFKNGELEGPHKQFYDNGKIKVDGNFKNGKRHGANRWYNQEEEVTIAAEYANGEKVKDLPLE